MDYVHASQQWAAKTNEEEFPMEKKYVYLFKEGNANMRELLGGKGANLA